MPSCFWTSALFGAVTVMFAPMALCNPEALCQSPYFGR